MKKILIEKEGFTLAEVLITLGIIGIVAAMTIPTLMNKTNEREWKSAWKKAFSTISWSTEKMAHDNGGSLEDYFSSATDMRDKYATYMLKARTCDDSQAEGCSVSNIKNLDGTPNGLATGPSMVLNDGAVVQFWLDSSACKSSVGTPEIFTACGGAAIDINGKNNPNTMGKDIFEFHILKNKIVPFGVEGDVVTASDCVATGTGKGCAAKYLYTE